MNMELPTKEKYLQGYIDSGTTKGYTLEGELEWDDEDKEWVKGYHESPGASCEGDWLWTSNEENVWAIYHPQYGDRFRTETKQSIMEILQYLANRRTVCIGRTNNGMVMWKVPSKVRLKGMVEWIEYKPEEDDIKGTREPDKQSP